jgi:hypothetical protein
MTSIEWLMQEIMGKEFRNTISDNDLNRFQEAEEMHKQEMEISDKEIWIKSNEIGKLFNSSIASQFFYEGCKWYREQLKCKGSDKKD